MKQINLLAVFAVIVVVAVVIAVAVFLIPKEKPEEISYDGFFDCASFAEVKDYANQVGITGVDFWENYCTVYNVPIWGESVTIDYTFDDKEVTQKAVARFELYSHADYVDEGEDFDAITYEFTQEEKDKIDEAFGRVKGRIEGELGVSLGRYAMIPARPGGETDKAEEQFYQGYFTKLYHVYDNNGNLWLVYFSASYGMSNAQLVRVHNERLYETVYPEDQSTNE